jgi:hypothetical protein
MRRRRAPRRSIAPDPFSYLAGALVHRNSDFLPFALQLEDNESPMTPVENARTRTHAARRGLRFPSHAHISRSHHRAAAASRSIRVQIRIHRTLLAEKGKNNRVTRRRTFTADGNCHPGQVNPEVLQIRCPLDVLVRQSVYVCVSLSVCK